MDLREGREDERTKLGGSDRVIVGDGTTYCIAKDKHRDDERREDSGVVMELIVHEAHARGEHRGCQRAVDVRRQQILKQRDGIDYLTNVMLLIRARIVHFSLSGKFLES